jgi:protein TonB
MKFVELKSRGGDYLVVASNIAYLRTDENGQTKVGLVGGDSLLVVGSMSEVAAQVLAGVAEMDRS